MAEPTHTHLRRTRTFAVRLNTSATCAAVTLVLAPGIAHRPSWFWGPDSLFERVNHVPTVALHAASAAAGVRCFVLVSTASDSTGRT